MGNCKLNGGANLRRKKQQRSTQKMRGGASSDLVGSEYQGQGPVVNQGTPYVGFDLNGNTSEVAGSYAPLASSSHQCGGKMRKQRKSQKQQRRKQRKGQKQQRRKSQKQQRRKQRKTQKQQRKK